MAKADIRRPEIVEIQPVHVRSVVDGVVQERDFLQVLPFSLVRIIPKIFCGHTCLIIAERTLAIDEELCVCFIDWQKAFDRVNCTKLMQILKRTGIDWREKRLISKL